MTASSYGKGSGRRPTAVSEEKAKANWDLYHENCRKEREAKRLAELGENPNDFPKIEDTSSSKPS